MSIRKIELTSKGSLAINSNLAASRAGSLFYPLIQKKKNSFLPSLHLLYQVLVCLLNKNRRVITNWTIWFGILTTKRTTSINFPINLVTELQSGRENRIVGGYHHSMGV